MEKIKQNSGDMKGSHRPQTTTPTPTTKKSTLTLHYLPITNSQAEKEN